MAEQSAVARDDFDAALIPGFRAATRAEYGALDAAWNESSSRVLGPDGQFRDGVARTRDCPLCGGPSSQARLRFAKLGMRILSCANCGMTYSRETLRPDLDRELYLSSASQDAYRVLKRNESYAALERLKCRYLVQQLGRFRAPPGRLLDIGPGAGRLLQAALEAGWNAAGIEASPDFAAVCRSAGLQVMNGFFPECPGLEQKYDALTLLDVLEHVENPQALLASVRAKLFQGGVAMVQVPNIDSLLVRAEGAANTNFCHGHWNHFNAGTLSRMAAQAGFSILHVETVISELDRIQALDPAAVADSIRAVTAAPPPAAGINAQWLHANRMGYKVVGFFGRLESDA